MSFHLRCYVPRPLSLTTIHRQKVVSACEKYVVLNKTRSSAILCDIHIPYTSWEKVAVSFVQDIPLQPCRVK
jgi:hypothetical protein